ncbi:hypothetical protein [Psychroserpens sp.]
MTIVDSNVASQILKQEQSDAGMLHFFNHIAVVEFNEGLHIDLNSGKKTIHDLMKYFGTTKPFGLIANRVNSYSISLLETIEVKSIFPNMVAYGVVSHNEAGRMNAVIESGFCSSNNISYDNIYEAIDTVYKNVKEKIMVSLN